MAPDPSRFRCTECGDCCRRHRVPVTAMDIARLTDALGCDAVSIVEWLPPEAVDMTGEPSSFVVLPEGRRLPVLAFANGACRFLDGANRCAVYPSRPLACRTFPLEREDEDSSTVHLRILEGAECPGEFDAPRDEAAIVARLAARDRELARNLAIVSAWNRRQKLRRFAGRRPEAAETFLKHAVDSARER